MHCKVYHRGHDNADEPRYFLFHASLIPIHCLRRLPQHKNAPDWRSQILGTLNILDAMCESNPNSAKCYDLIYRLCGNQLQIEDFSFNDDPSLQGQRWDETQWDPNWNFDMDMSLSTGAGPNTFVDECTSLWSDEMWNQPVWPAVNDDPNLNLMI